MTRHVKILRARTFEDNIETDGSDTLARQIYDTIAAKTMIGFSITKSGQHYLAVVIFDD